MPVGVGMFDCFLLLLPLNNKTKSNNQNEIENEKHMQQ
jgi:hypothetical protein